MDYEKLIDDLRSLLGQYGEKIPYGELVCAEGGYGRAGDLVWTDPEPYYIEQSADAITALLAENERLRADLSEMKSQLDMYGGDEGITATFSELEQVKREREKLERFLGELEGAVYTGQYFHLRPMIEKWRGQKEG